MVAKGSRKKNFLVVAAFSLAALGAALWMERASLLAWMQVRGLARAGETDRARWVERVVNLDETAAPPLLQLFISADEVGCSNARIAFEHLIQRWGLEDPRTQALARRLSSTFPQMSRPGQENTLFIAQGWFSQGTAPTALTELRHAAVQLIGAAARDDQANFLPALKLCEMQLTPPLNEETLTPARALVQASLQADLPSVRIQAVRVALREGLELLEAIVPLLHDPETEVRRAAILAAGPADHVVTDETLLPCLHDPDPEVCRLCEAALQARGLRPEHVHLGRLLTDPRATVRLQVLDHLHPPGDLDPGLWLRRLSHDSSPAVRAGAVRMISQLEQVSLDDRMDQMARDDPSPSVSALARFYLKNPNRSMPRRVP